jgi:predicted MPP superfamily phosphohydrolase
MVLAMLVLPQVIVVAWSLMERDIGGRLQRDTRASAEAATSALSISDSRIEGRDAERLAEISSHWGTRIRVIRDDGTLLADVDDDRGTDLVHQVGTLFFGPDGAPTLREFDETVRARRQARRGREGDGLVPAGAGPTAAASRRDEPGLPGAALVLRRRHFTVVSALPAALVMPVAAGIDRVLSLTALAPKTTASASPASAKITRRDVIGLGSASLPAAFALGGASGFVQARRDPTIPLIRLRYPGLHPDLEGLRILQLGDLHLGACLGIDDLERGLELARTHRPDLIVLTGDLADDPTLIPEALRLVAAANARLGALASLGNHEYLHDIEITRPLYEASPVPLLVGSGRALRVGRATLYVGGADDPVRMRGPIPRLLAPSIDAAAAGAPSQTDFRLLLCHRPGGFAPANDAGFDLTLSGHTHGGQLGLFGRSLLERFRPDVGWWGTYAKKRPPAVALARQKAGVAMTGPSRLYTTSGFGHWFPFRVGCPTEMPVLVLEADPRGAPADRPRLTLEVMPNRIKAMTHESDDPVSRPDDPPRETVIDGKFGPA